MPNTRARRGQLFENGFNRFGIKALVHKIGIEQVRNRVIKLFVGKFSRLLQRLLFFRIGKIFFPHGFDFTVVAFIDTFRFHQFNVGKNGADDVIFIAQAFFSEIDIY